MSPRGPCRPKTERTMYVISHGKEVKVFAGNANRPLAEAICDQLSKKLGACTVSAFADGEVSLSLAEPVRGSDVFIVQSTCKPVNDNLMELLVMIDAMRRASAGRITAVMPYFGYARQDRKAKSRDPISAKLVANLLNVEYTVLSFETVFFDSMGNAIPEVSDGNKFSQRQKDSFRRLSRGKRFYISRVRAIGPDGIERDLSPIEIIVN